MKDGTPSRTAQWVAAARGMGMLLPDAVRIADDPYGAAFSSPAFSRLLGRSGRSLATLAAMPGLRTWIIYMQVRTRVLDDAVRAFVAAGGRQLVLLGAGYDCRALRLSELAGATVYEVDHPATQGHKRVTLERIGARSPAHYVEWDFETRAMEDLPEALVQAGHDPTARTLTIWEGVTMYLTDGAIDSSLRAIAAYSAPGSQLAMTYFALDRLTRPSLATRVVQAAVARLGEPWKFGWHPEELPGYLRERGFELASDRATPDAAHELLPHDLARLLDRAADRRIAVAVAAESIAVANR
ncbi:MAG: SAM-dependent methyltransferase [Kofleriaceae bacterium]